MMRTFIATMARVGWLSLIIAPPVNAWQWSSLWQTADQQAKQMMATGHYSEAAQTFQRRDWRATAAFQAKDYARAAREYAQLNTVDGAYNAGNALALMGQYQQAIAAYDQALAKNPKHQDAQFNRDLVKAILDQQKQDPKKNDNKSQKNKDSSKQNHQDPGSKPQQKKPEEQKQPNENKSPAQPSDENDKTKPNPQKPLESKPKPLTPAEREQKKADEQWLQLIPDDPGGLLREKFLRDHLKRQGEWAS